MRKPSRNIGDPPGGGGSGASAVSLLSIIVASGLLLSVWIAVAFGLAVYSTITVNSQANRLTLQQQSTVWVNSDTGDDANDGTSQTRPVFTIERALTILESTTALVAIIELDGATAAHDFGTDLTINFFPLISLYGNIIIRGRKLNVSYGNVNQVNVSAQGDRFISIGTNISVATDTFKKHFVTVSDGTNFIVSSQGANGTFNIVGGNYQGAEMPDTWRVNQTFVAFQTSTVVEWTGNITLLASFSRVTFEAITFVPLTSTSQIRAPAYRDDALIFRACKFTNIQNVASFAGSIARTGESNLFPLLLDKRALIRGSFYLNGGYIEGNATNAAFTTQQLDVKLMLYSVWMKGAHMACVGMCNILGMLSENLQEYAVFTEASHFYIQGFKAIGNASSGNSVAIGSGSSTLGDISNVRLEFTSGLGGIFFDSVSTALLSVIDISLTNAPYGVRFGEDISARVSNATIRAQYPISARTTCSITLVNYQEYISVGTTTPALYFERNHRVYFVGLGPWIINWNTSTVAPLFFDHSIVEMIGGGNMHIASNPAVPCISATKMTDIRILANFTNENGVTPSNVIKVGANPSGPLNTQTDYATAGTELCKLLVG